VQHLQHFPPPSEIAAKLFFTFNCIYNDYFNGCNIEITLYFNIYYCVVRELKYLRRYADNSIQ